MSDSLALRLLFTGSLGPLAGGLRAQGHQVDLSADAASAVAVARSKTLDVILLDAKNGAGNPFSLAKDVRAASLWRKPMFVLIAGENDANCESCCREAGIDLLLLEPFPLELLTKFLHRLGTVLGDYESFDPSI